MNERGGTLKVSYNYEIDKYKTISCGNADEIRAIMQLRIDFSNIPNYNNFYFSESGSNDDHTQLWIEANGGYAYLYFIDGDKQWQSLNDQNDLDPNGETLIIPGDPVSFSNAYFVTIEAAISSAIEFCETAAKPVNIQWEAMFEE